MRIVVVGAGKLGYSIAELLSNEDFDVVVVDNDANQLEAVKDNLDVLTIMANGSSPITMADPDIKGADMLIAVTASDEVNMISCILAKKQGVAHSVARIRDMQFISEAKDYLKHNFDIDLMLNPELITAREIHRILMTPAALSVEDFANGKVRLFEAKVQRRSPVAKIPFKELQLPDGVLAAMIYRDHQLIIPHGDDMLKPHDNAYFVGRPEAIEQFSTNFVQRDARKPERIIIIGGGRITRFLLPMFAKDNLQVKVVEKNPERCEIIASSIENGLVVHGDGTDIDLMQEEGIADADVVICLTSDDKLNLMLALLAKHLGARRTVVRVVRLEYKDLMLKVGVDIALSARMLSAGEVLAFARRGGVVSVSMLEGAQAEAVEVIVQNGSAVAGKPLMEARLPRECLVCAYVRQEKAYIPNGRSVLLPGDRVIIIIRDKQGPKVTKYFKGE